MNLFSSNPEELNFKKNENNKSLQKLHIVERKNGMCGTCNKTKLTTKDIDICKEWKIAETIYEVLI